MKCSGRLIYLFAQFEPLPEIPIGAIYFVHERLRVVKHQVQRSHCLVWKVRLDQVMVDWSLQLQNVWDLAKKNVKSALIRSFKTNCHFQEDIFNFKVDTFELLRDQQFSCALEAQIILLTFEDSCKIPWVKSFSCYCLPIIVIVLDVLNIFCKVDKRLIWGNQLEIIDEAGTLLQKHVGHPNIREYTHLNFD
jgi:hypothetical protein